MAQDYVQFIVNKKNFKKIKINKNLESAYFGD